MAETGNIITTPDGSRTAHNERFGEAYGSRHGAAAQAHHVFLNGTGTNTHPAPRVLEIGFGVGVNYRATLSDTAERGVPLEYVAYEFDPAPAHVLQEVAEGGEGAEHPAWVEVVKQWEASSRTRRSAPPSTAPTLESPQGPVASPLTINTACASVALHFADVLSADLGEGWATAIYLDGFSPTRNPEVWTPEFVARLTRALAPGGVLATYSAAGHVRRALATAGLHVTRRPGAPGKRECLRAEKPTARREQEVGGK
ncbi:tRNA (5-methylaminomethyl-2-thiouridine)(34)-methyltransferase MnmD [Deinococcus fonticola]|uniref:tRNA (5-methylaminomethyl-2-thiouridine)(34)-methyltransferase MnmD n=1 Tax=Deinococcus fonticola TaxID=2528713 RepID=UPI0010751757|nr:tRNA (5-methylaminomethyl-2-thiouridine)(34)-methyltransferase MnmD [Deinococcus fonticola]